MTRLMSQLLDIAADQHGFVTTDNAKEIGVDPTQLRLLCARGQMERRTRGVYFVPHFGIDEKTEFQEAVLWAKGRGVIAAESALALWDLADVNPRRISLVVPPEYNPRRQGREKYRVERRVLPNSEVTWMDGIPVTTPKQSIQDAHDRGTDRNLLRQAIETALDRGLITAAEGLELTHVLKDSR